MNQDMVCFDHNVLKKGKGPLVMEPVKVEIQLPANRGNAIVNILDHEGCRTGQTLPPQNGKVILGGAQPQGSLPDFSWCG
jgi:hypothetical protein